MGIFECSLIGLIFLADVYATSRAIKSYRRFNKQIKEINCYDLRKAITHMREDVEIRKSQH